MGKFLRTVCCLLVSGSAAGQAPEIDSETRAFATYVNDVSRLNGMYRGIADYCKPHVPALILTQSDALWRSHNGAYIDSVDVAIQRYAAAKADPDHRTQVIQQLKANARAWFQHAHDKNKLLDQLQSADDKPTACSKMLGTMSSESFYLKKMMPEDDLYWSKNLQP